MSDRDCRASCDRARELAYQNGEFGALYTALLYCEPCADDARYARVPRWALRAARDFFARDVAPGLRSGMGRHARWLEQRAQARMDRLLMDAVDTATRAGHSQEAAIAAVAHEQDMPEDTVKHAYERGRIHGDVVTAGTGCPWVAWRFYRDVVGNPEAWQEAPDCLPGCPCDPPDDPIK